MTDQLYKYDNRILQYHGSLGLLTTLCNSMVFFILAIIIFIGTILSILVSIPIIFLN